ncbi:hypothetical protein C7964_102332 [Loktanella sp. PT4BL]|jgi:hypothetical protein|uniref:hypothetical protein n=1 Tax=Loktanella sp. PT4BL TaxID=2135611 RepID=UPI000D768780|nr:hypothetical protein [Loktanella sp. PT4BL]PXW70445.1 hypothetical protein C7964_102332 [Loktanella sp. PT4BL]
MARTASYPVKLRRDHIALYCEQNHPCTFKQVLQFAQEKPLPAMPDALSKQIHTVRSDLHKLRQDGSIKPEWLIVKNDW